MQSSPNHGLSLHTSHACWQQHPFRERGGKKASSLTETHRKDTDEGWRGSGAEARRRWMEFWGNAWPSEGASGHHAPLSVSWAASVLWAHQAPSTSGDAEASHSSSTACEAFWQRHRRTGSASPNRITYTHTHTCNAPSHMHSSSLSHSAFLSPFRSLIGISDVPPSTCPSLFQ